jgi:hypothetical protein
MTDEKKKIPLHRERLDIPDNKEAQKLREDRKKQLREDLRATFGPSAGRRVLRHLMNLAGYKKIKIGGNPQLGMDVLQGSFYNVTREQLVIEFIELMPVDILKDVEFGTISELE